MITEKRFYGTPTAVVGFLLLFAALASLVTGIVLAAKKTNAVLFEHEIERAANGLAEDFARNNHLDYEYVDDRIIAFGIVRRSGTVIASYGEPLEIGAVPVGSNRGPVYVYDKKKSVVTLYRPVGMPMIQNRGHMMQPRVPSIDPAYLLYLRIDATDHFRQQRLYAGVAITGPALIGILTGLLFYLYIRNIHYRRRIADREKLAQLGESARTLVHEIKNPLNAINIRASILAKTDSEEVVQDARAIREEVERLKNLADKINTFLKNPVGEIEEIEVVQYTREILKANRWERVRFVDEMTADAAVSLVRFDRERFRSVIENVVSNAYESEQDVENESGSIEISVEVKKKTIILRVRDRGTGLPEIGGDQLFNPFFTTKTQGSGIGLAVSRRFMQAAGGDIELRPRQVRGTEVVLTFPRVMP